ncbi:MAG: hypothetical protein N2035_05200 [Chthoniobacterales bacterium]|nr:hypothetical protein [Chthoniobacterales bacterium]
MKFRQILLLLILAALLFFGFFWFQRQESAARDARALRQLQLWGIALNLYLIDNDNFLPEVGTNFQDSPYAWFEVLPPYLSQPPLSELIRNGNNPAPGSPSLWSSPRASKPRVWDKSQVYSTWAMNRALQPDPTSRPYRIQELNLPGNVIFLTEGSGFSPGLLPHEISTAPGLPRNSKTLPVLFCDGHAQPVPRRTLLASETRTAENLQKGISWFIE